MAECGARGPQAMSPRRAARAPPSPYVHSMPAWVLEDFCHKMDCLGDHDWMRFASYVITDQTELRKIKCMEKTGISITRELMWWWGVRLATVQQLLDLLQGLQLYRAAQVILDWISPSGTANSEKEELVEPPKQENISLTPTESKNKERENEISLLPSPDSSQLGISPARALLALRDAGYIYSVGSQECISQARLVPSWLHAQTRSMHTLRALCPSRCKTNLGQKRALHVSTGRPAWEREQNHAMC